MKKPVLLCYGVVLVINGVYRYVSAPDGMTGLIFGLVMGAMALAAGLLEAKSQAAMYVMTRGRKPVAKQRKTKARRMMTGSTAA